MKFQNSGKVLEVKDGIVLSTGLSEVGFNEIVSIQTKKGESVQGLALNLEKDRVGIVVLGEFDGIAQGDLVTAQSKLLSLEISVNILGRVINSMGEAIDGKELNLQGSKTMPLEQVAPGVSDRQDVFRPVQTGIKSIDAMIPIGKGQRELIIGDRQTGKTAIAIDTIINQRGKNIICIYVGIGQKSSKMAQIRSKLEQEGAMEYSVILAANASDPASLQYIAPYSGTAIGEYFTQQGKDVLIVYDDLTKHAWAYREISLLLRRPPGREAYPGDVFYLHSKLLERAVQFSKKLGGGSLTALPIIETQAGDISAYIPTNVISITDGQIYLEPDLFNSGQRPAVNVGLSVSRVGGAAQTKAMKDIAGQLRLDLAQYRELAAFAQFGSELDEETQSKLDRGARMQELLKQKQYDPFRLSEQIMIIFAGSKGYLDDIEVSEIGEWERTFRIYLKEKHEKLFEKLDKGEKVDEKTEGEMKKVVEGFKW